MPPALVNLRVDLARYDDEDANAARAALAASAVTIDVLAPETDDAVLSWIDETFGGTWSAEAFRSTTIVARQNGKPVGFASIDARGLTFTWLPPDADAALGIFGPFGVAPHVRGGRVAPHLLTLALCELRRRGFAFALVPAVSEGSLAAYYQRHTGADVATRFDVGALLTRRPRTLVMASGSGTNFQAVLDAVAAGQLPIDLCALVCNKAEAFVLERARKAEVPGIHNMVWDRRAESRTSYDARLQALVEAEAPELILLLGWMHLLDRGFVNRFPALLNVHPAFLPHAPAADTVVMPDGNRIPAIRGAHAITDAHEAKLPWTGVSVHVVTPATDRGEIVMRRPVAIAPDRPLAELEDSVHRIEHALVPAAVRSWLFRR